MTRTKLASWIAGRLQELDLKPAQIDRETRGEITASYLSRVLKGKRPGADWLKRLAPVLQTDVLFLYGLAGYLDDAPVSHPPPIDPLEQQALRLVRAAVPDERDWLSGRLAEVQRLMLDFRRDRSSEKPRAV